MDSAAQVQSFGDIRLEGQGNTLIINQLVQISVEEVKTRAFVASSPYLGLGRFEERHKDFFFGRDQLVAELLNLIAERSLVMVTGASGSGKSSLVRSGLLPQLGMRLPQGHFRPLVMTPDRDPFLSLRSALHAAGLMQRQTDAIHADAKESLATTLTRLRPSPDLWLLFIDQFEELFTLCADSALRMRFITELLGLATAAIGELRIVLAMRADFFDRLGAYPELGKSAERGLCMVYDMQPSDLRAAIEQPAARHGVIFEAGLVDQIIADVQGRAGTLPLLQYTLDQVWREDCPESDRTLNAATYHRLGGVEGALRKRADALYEFGDRQQLPRSETQKERIRRIFLRLVDFTSEDSDARAVSRRAMLTDFDSAEDQALIAELIEEKLLVSNAAVTPALVPRGSTVAVAHEALLGAWPRLKQWLEQAHEVIYVRNRLRGDAYRWTKAATAEGSSSNEELWAGSRLKQAIDIQLRGDFQTVLGGLTSEETAFLSASAALRERRVTDEQARRDELARMELSRQRQRNRFLMLGVALLTLFGGFMLYAQRETKQAELDLIVEQGRYLLAEKNRPAEALLWLHSAYARDARAPMLPYLLGEAARSVDALHATMVGHQDDVVMVSFSPDGRRVLTASYDRTARVWDADTGAPTPPFELKGHREPLHTATFSSDGRRIVTASRDDSARIWAADTGALIAKLEGHTGDVYSASFSPDAHRVVTANYDGNARVFTAESGSLLFTIGRHSEGFLTASFSPDGRYIVTASEDTTGRVFDSAGGMLLARLEGHSARIQGASFSPDSRRVVTASHDHTARVWEVENGRLLLPPLSGHSDRVVSASFSPDGQRIVTASEDTTARVFNADTGEILFTLRGHERRLISARFSPDGRHIVTASKDKTARIWETDTGRSLRTFSVHDDGLLGVAFSPDGHYLATASGDKTARVWEADRRSSVTVVAETPATLLAAGFSADGRNILTVDRGRTLRTWESETGRLLDSRPISWDPTARVSFSADGQRIFTCTGDGGMQLFEIPSGKLLESRRLPFSATSGLRLSPNAQRVVTFGNNAAAQVGEVSSGKILSTLQGHEGDINDASFSPDSSRIITASKDGSARIWDAMSGNLLIVLEGHEEAVLTASFSPDGRRVITDSASHSLRVWETATGRLLISWMGTSGPPDTIGVARFSPDGKRVIATSDSKTLRIWDVSAESRSLVGLTTLMRCRLVRRLENGRIVSAVPDVRACADLPKSTPQPLQ